ncbi:MAG: pyridoxamine 5'-phosphate oxidase family protein [Bacteroidota bacterium]
MIQSTHTTQEALKLIWQEIRRGTVDRRHPFRFLTLATIRGQQPVQRTLVSRKLDDQNRIWLYTDARSGKMSDRENNDAASLLFYHPKKQLQISMACRLQVEQDPQIRRDIWSGFADFQQKDYNRKFLPGQQLSSPDGGWLSIPEEGFPNFVLLQAVAHQIDCLQLDRSGHLRLSFEKGEQGQWQGNWIAP